MKKVSSSATADSRSGQSKRRPYQAPEVLSRESLESAANICSGFGTKDVPGRPNPTGDPNNQQDVCGATALQS